MFNANVQRGMFGSNTNVQSCMFGSDANDLCECSELHVLKRCECSERHVQKQCEGAACSEAMQMFFSKDANLTNAIWRHAHILQTYIFTCIVISV